MNGPRTIQSVFRTRSRRLCGPSVGSAGLPRLPQAVAPCQGPIAGVGQAVPRGRQRAAAALACASRGARLEIGRRDSAREGRTARGGVHFPDCSGLPSEQGQLVRRDLAQARKDPGLRPGHGARIQARGLSKKRSPLSVSRTSKALYSSVSRTRASLSCSVSRTYPGQKRHFLCSVSRTPSRYAISRCSLNDTRKGAYA